jgi:monoamine oxidase
VFNGVMCTEIADLPLAHVIDLVRRTPLTGEELQYVVAGTMHAVAEDLAATLHHPPLLGNPVRAVEVGEFAVSVIADHGTVAADHLVLAVPPSALAGIAIDPPLPQRVQAAAAAFRPGSVMKFMLRYERAFWSDADVGPTRAWLEPRGLYVGDASIDDVPMLVGFLGGPATAEWRSLGAAARRRALLDHLVEAYGAEAGHPTSFVERDWCPDDWGGGGYWNVLLDHAQHDAVEVLRGGAPGITFASTELAPTFPGYVEGAITAGRDAAERVLRSLGRVCQSDEP